MNQSSASYSVSCEPMRWEACRCIQLVLLGMVLAVLLALTAHGAEYALLDGKHKCVPDRLLVVPKRGAAFAGHLAAGGVSVVSVERTFYHVCKTNAASRTVLRRETPAQAGERLQQLLADFRASGLYEVVEPNGLLSAFALTPFVPTDTYYVDGTQWALNNLASGGVSLQPLPVWKLTRGAPSGTPVIAAILDTGSSPNHPDLAGRVLVGYNAITGSTDTTDGNRHGTHCSGILAATANNSNGRTLGVAPEAMILPVQMLDSNGSGDYASAIRAFNFVKTNTTARATVVSCSWGGTSESALMNQAVQELRTMGIIVVAAAGNDGESLDSHAHYPASYPGVISVGAIDSTGALASFSNFGASVTVAAPGVAIWSCVLANRWASLSGTSMACPAVAGAVVLLRAINPSLTETQIVALLKAASPPTAKLAGKTSTGGHLNLAALASNVATPTLTSDLADVSGTVGSSVTLTATYATLASPLLPNTFTWMKILPEGHTQVTAPNSGTMTIASVNPNHAGRFYVVCSNDWGTAVTSRVATLTVNGGSPPPPPPPPPPVPVGDVTMSIGDVTGLAGSAIEVSVISIGTNAAYSGSIAFDKNVLTLTGVSFPGSAFSSLANTNTAGLIGLLVAFNPAAPVTGTNGVATLRFTIAANASNSVALTWADAPVTREVVGGSGRVVSANWVPGTVTVQTGYEGDVDGDGRVGVADILAIAQAVVGLRTPQLGREFAAMDTDDNGRLTASDVFIAITYALGLAQAPALGGPTGPTPVAPLTVSASAGSTPEVLRIHFATASPLHRGTNLIDLTYQGRVPVVGLSGKLSIGPLGADDDVAFIPADGVNAVGRFTRTTTNATLHLLLVGQGALEAASGPTAGAALPVLATGLSDAKTLGHLELVKRAADRRVRLRWDDLSTDLVAGTAGAAPALFDGLYLQAPLQLRAARVGREFGLLLSPAGDLIQELNDEDAAAIGIEYSDDLRGWHPLGATVSVTAGIGSVIDPEAARRPFRFYRIRGGR